MENNHEYLHSKIENHEHTLEAVLIHQYLDDK